MQLTFADARNMGPRRVAQYMRENLSKPEQLSEMLRLANKGIDELLEIQREAAQG